LEHRKSTHEAPSTLSQDFLNFNESDDGDLETSTEQGREDRLSPNEAYELLNPRIKSLLSVIQSTGLTRSELAELNGDFLMIEEKILGRLSRKRQSSSSHFVSSNLTDHNRRKTHGTKHMKYS
jgi:hypothetical protein